MSEFSAQNQLSKPKVVVTSTGLELLKDLLKPEDNPFKTPLKNLSLESLQPESSKEEIKEKNSKLVYKLYNSVKEPYPINTLGIVMHQKRGSIFFNRSKSKEISASSPSPKSLAVLSPRDDLVSPDGQFHKKSFRDGGSFRIGLKSIKDTRGSKSALRESMSHQVGQPKNTFGDILRRSTIKIKHNSQFLEAMGLSKANKKELVDGGENKRTTRFYINEKLDGLKAEGSDSQYMQERTKKALDEINIMNKILKKDGSMHDFIKFLNHGKGVHPCNAKYSSLLGVKVSDFDFTDLNFDRFDLQRLIAKRLEPAEKAYISLSSTLKKRKKFLPVQSKKNTTGFSTLEFKKNDEFFNKKLFLKHTNEIDKEFSDIFLPLEKDKNSIQRVEVSRWRLGKTQLEESSFKEPHHRKTSSFRGFNSHSRATSIFKSYS